MPPERVQIREFPTYRELTKLEAEQIVRRHIARAYLAYELQQALKVLVKPSF